MNRKAPKDNLGETLAIKILEKLVRSSPWQLPVSLAENKIHAQSEYRLRGN